MSIYVLYHRDTDGAFAAAAACSVYGDGATYISVQYGEDFPIKHPTENDEIFILDFSYKRELLDKIDNIVSKLIVLDHHTSAEKELKGTSYATFDMNKCGSTLAWEYFRSQEDMPEIYHLVEDRDLFRYSFKDTDLVVEGLKLYDLTDIMLLTENLKDPVAFLKQVLLDGRPLLICRKQSIRSKIASNKVILTTLDGHSAAIINEHDHISDSASAMLSKYETDIAVCWFATPKHVVFSLRSVGDISVGDIAVSRDGGGHKNSAGFRLPLKEGLKLINGLYSG